MNLTQFVPAVSNTSPIVLYGKIGRINLLQDVFGQIVVPQAVVDEVLAYGLDTLEAAAGQESPWISVQRIVSLTTHDDILGLDIGDSHALMLALQMGSAVPILLDDLPARRAGERHGLSVVGSAGLALIAKRRGFIPAVRPVLQELLDAGLYLSDRVYFELVENAGE